MYRLIETRRFDVSDLNKTRLGVKRFVIAIDLTIITYDDCLLTTEIGKYFKILVLFNQNK